MGVLCVWYCVCVGMYDGWWVVDGGWWVVGGGWWVVTCKVNIGMVDSVYGMDVDVSMSKI